MINMNLENSMKSMVASLAIIGNVSVLKFWLTETGLYHLRARYYDPYTAGISLAILPHTAITALAA